MTSDGLIKETEGSASFGEGPEKRDLGEDGNLVPCVWRRGIHRFVVMPLGEKATLTAK